LGKHQRQLTNQSTALPNPFFQFKQFTVHHDRCAMKVTTEACLFGAWVAMEIQNTKSGFQRLLDIGTGSGLLSLLVAQKNSLQIEAIEIDKNAAEQAGENIAASPWHKQINVIHQDMLTWKTEKKYDCIISNPPFYENELRSKIPGKNIAHHDDGLRLSQLLAFIKDHLLNDGFFFLLLPTKREAEFEKALNQFDFHLQKRTIVKQSVHHKPFRLMIRAGHRATNCSTTEMAIRNANGAYTDDFIVLLKDYYLHL
jgi:tRNA1Val (adenine37-N6)-methyltransferase